MVMSSVTDITVVDGGLDPPNSVVCNVDGTVVVVVVIVVVLVVVVVVVVVVEVEVEVSVVTSSGWICL